MRVALPSLSAAVTVIVTAMGDRVEDPDAAPDRVAAEGAGLSRSGAASLVWWLGPLLLLLSIAGAYRLRAAAVVECHIGINAGAGMFTFIGLAVIALVVVPVLMEVARRLLPAAPAAAVVLLLAVVAGMVLLGSSAPPLGYPQDVLTCRGNRPPWWPSWLPG